jgi:hypothetical protein
MKVSFRNSSKRLSRYLIFKIISVLKMILNVVKVISILGFACMFYTHMLAKVYVFSFCLDCKGLVCGNSVIISHTFLDYYFICIRRCHLLILIDN